MGSFVSDAFVQYYVCRIPMFLFLAIFFTSLWCSLYEYTWIFILMLTDIWSRAIVSKAAMNILNTCILYDISIHFCCVYTWEWNCCVTGVVAGFVCIDNTKPFFQSGFSFQLPDDLLMPSLFSYSLYILFVKCLFPIFNWVVRYLYHNHLLPFCDLVFYSWFFLA